MSAVVAPKFITGFEGVPLDDLRAYDYDDQRWVRGEAARLLLIDQMTQDLEILRGPGGPAYIAFVRKAGDTTTVEQATVYCESVLETLTMIGGL